MYATYTSTNPVVKTWTLRQLKDIQLQVLKKIIIIFKYCFFRFLDYSIHLLPKQDLFIYP